MKWFEHKTIGETVCMASVTVGGTTIRAVLDSGFFLHNKPRFGEAHSHLNFELYLLAAGECSARCAERAFRLSEEEVLLIPPNCPHHIAESSADAAVYSLRFSLCRDEERGFPALPEAEAALSSPRKLRSRALLSLLADMRRECALGLPLFEEKLEGLFTAFFAELLRLFAAGSLPADPPSPFSVPLSPGRVERFGGYQSHVPDEYYIDLLDTYFTHLPKEASLAGLAEQLHLSQSQTKRLIRASYGTTFKERLIGARIARAKHLVGVGELSLEEIAAEVGYSSYNAFFTAFKNAEGMTPSQYKAATNAGKEG